MLFRSERVCRAQVLAMSTGHPMSVLDDDVVAKVNAPSTDDPLDGRARERLYFSAMKRVLDRDLPGYAD